MTWHRTKDNEIQNRTIQDGLGNKHWQQSGRVKVKYGRGQGTRTVPDKNDVMMAMMKDVEPAGKRRDSRTSSGSMEDYEGVGALFNTGF
jgi:hypothetical protein